MKRILMACALALVACTKPVAPVAPEPNASAPVVVAGPVAAQVVPVTPVAVAPSAKAKPSTAKPKAAAKPRVDGEAAAYAKAYANAARANKLLGEPRYKVAMQDSGEGVGLLIEIHRSIGGFYHASLGKLANDVLDRYVLLLTMTDSGEIGYVAPLNSKVPYVFQGLPACREKLAELVQGLSKHPELPPYRLTCVLIGDAPLRQPNT